MNIREYSTDIPVELVVDASVLINLVASGVGDIIADSLPFPLLTPSVVVGELERGLARGRADYVVVMELADKGLIRIADLADSEEAEFLDLISGATAETLDDGEAAVIAYSVPHSGIAVLDDSKAERIAASRHRHLKIANSVDLFKDSGVQDALGPDGVSAALLKALQLARMRVPPVHVNWVVETIGKDNASRCTSFPRSIRRS